ncbi:hypothetical protein MHBO_002746 [Bonamia ostreae]|uniref:Uncharacterized protein n=1 Tax=Bonamia ostreae TaxID=126728 RepID=A0ABV2ANE8_9EUKA
MDNDFFVETVLLKNGKFQSKINSHLIRTKNVKHKGISVLLPLNFKKSNYLVDSEVPNATFSGKDHFGFKLTFTPTGDAADFKIKNLKVCSEHVFNLTKPSNSSKQLIQNCSRDLKPFISKSLSNIWETQSIKICLLVPKSYKKGELCVLTNSYKTCKTLAPILLEEDTNECLITNCAIFPDRLLKKKIIYNHVLMTPKLIYKKENSEYEAIGTANFVRKEEGDVYFKGDLHKGVKYRWIFVSSQVELFHKQRRSILMELMTRIPVKDKKPLQVTEEKDFRSVHLFSADKFNDYNVIAFTNPELCGIDTILKVLFYKH